MLTATSRVSPGIREIATLTSDAIGSATTHTPSRPRPSSGVMAFAGACASVRARRER